MWEDTVERGRPQMTIPRMRIACWIPKATNTHSVYIIIIAFPLQQWLHERASLLRYTYIPCFVTMWNQPNTHPLQFHKLASTCFESWRSFIRKLVVIIRYSLSCPLYCPYLLRIHTRLTIHHICGHILYHDACIITSHFLMMVFQGSKHVEETLEN